MIAFDDQCIQNLDVSEVYEAENAEMIPTIYANGAKMCIRDRMKDWLLKKLIETTDNVPMKTMLPGRTYGEE